MPSKVRSQISGNLIRKTSFQSHGFVLDIRFYITSFPHTALQKAQDQTHAQSRGQVLAFVPGFTLSCQSSKPPFVKRRLHTGFLLLVTGI